MAHLRFHPILQSRLHFQSWNRIQLSNSYVLGVVPLVLQRIVTRTSSSHQIPHPQHLLTTRQSPAMKLLSLVHVVSLLTLIPVLEAISDSSDSDPLSVQSLTDSQSDEPTGWNRRLVDIMTEDRARRMT